MVRDVIFKTLSVLTYNMFINLNNRAQVGSMQMRA